MRIVLVLWVVMVSHYPYECPTIATRTRTLTKHHPKSVPREAPVVVVVVVAAVAVIRHKRPFA